MTSRQKLSIGIAAMALFSPIWTPMTLQQQLQLRLDMLKAARETWSGK